MCFELVEASIRRGCCYTEQNLFSIWVLAPTNEVFVWPVMSIVSFLGILVGCCSSWLEFWKAGEPSDIYSRSDHVKSPSAEPICTKESTA